MNITFLIGNGFDRKLGMKTKYEHFYDYYMSLENKEQCVIDLKNRIDTDKDNWSDLEEELGRYTSEMKTELDAIKIYKDIIENLREYLIKEESKYIFEDKNNSLQSDLSSPEKYLRPTEQRELRKFKSVYGHWYIRIISFNYTFPIETILQYPKNKFEIRMSNINYSAILSEIEHIHGTTNTGMVLGVNDESQIHNQNLKTLKRIKNRYIKSACNSTYKSDHDAKCMQWVNDSHLICLFGLSYGETDKRWWEAISNNLLKNNSRLIIFHFIEEFTKIGNWGPDFEDEVDSIKNIFLSKTTLSDSEKEKVESKIYVSISSDIFNIICKIKETDEFSNDIL